MSTDIKAGDLLYAVGPGHHAPHGPTDLCVYSAVVKRVRLEGSYSESTTHADLARATYAIELSLDRHVLGFPKWTYHDHEIGLNVHRSAAEALRTFAERAQRCHDEAERARERAHREVEWASAQVALLKVST